MIFIFIPVNHTITLSQPHLFILTFLSKYCRIELVRFMNKSPDLGKDIDCNEESD